MDTKRCSHCGEDKPLDEFAKAKRSPDGRGYVCRPCRKEAQAIYYGNRKRGHSLDEAFEPEFGSRF